MTLGLRRARISTLLGRGPGSYPPPPYTNYIPYLSWVSLEVSFPNTPYAPRVRAREPWQDCLPFLPEPRGALPGGRQV